VLVIIISYKMLRQRLQLWSGHSKLNSSNNFHNSKNILHINIKYYHGFWKLPKSFKTIEVSTNQIWCKKYLIVLYFSNEGIRSIKYDVARIIIHQKLLDHVIKHVWHVTCYRQYLIFKVMCFGFSWIVFFIDNEH
jgi:predicted KAP-like P-loop ATPase